MPFTMIEKLSSIKFDMKFVLVKDWDEVADGKFDASKVVEEEVFGQKERGIW